MADFLTKNRRSEIMSNIKSKDTKPEILIRSKLHKLGYRYSLNRKDLPGRPDVVLPKYNSLIFINGCFWHQHKDCKISHIPKTNKDYWEPKLNKTILRDKQNIKKLKKLGWNVIVVWECNIKNNLLATTKYIIKKINKKY